MASSIRMQALPDPERPDFEPPSRRIGRYDPFVPESPHIGVYIRAYPASFRPSMARRVIRSYLQTNGLGNRTVLTEPLSHPGGRRFESA
jgi:hypothetical protein